MLCIEMKSLESSARATLQTRGGASHGDATCSFSQGFLELPSLRPRLRPIPYICIVRLYQHGFSRVGTLEVCRPRFSIGTADESSMPCRTVLLQSQLQDETISLEIPQDGFDLLSERLGWGNFGDVILAMLKPGASELEGPVEVAAKRLRTKNAKMKSKLVASVSTSNGCWSLIYKRSNLSTSFIKWLGNQTRVWSSFNHENILKFIGYYADEDFMVVYLFHPYLRNGNAETYLKSGQSTMDERVALVRTLLLWMW